LTFKEEDSSKPALTIVKSVFSRLWGEAVSQTKDKNTVDDLLAQIPADSALHVFSRDEFVPGDEPDTYQRDSKLMALLKEKNFTRAINQTPKLNDTVYDLIWIDDFHVFLGKHKNLPTSDGSPGNMPKINLPTQSPSRAYLKIVEAVQRFKPDIPKGIQVLEVGCSPGGATSAMLSWGVRVTGIDPKRVDMRIEGNPNFKLIQKNAIDVTASDLKSVNPEWLVLDMNLAPLETLDELGHVIACLRKNFDRTLLLRKGFLTIKLNDWKFADSIPLYLARIQEMGFKDLTATQLVSNRQEFFVMASGFQ
jgi:23S rRNA C2498 (ribose-2'-O)-methylase RlmM